MNLSQDIAFLEYYGVPRQRLEAAEIRGRKLNLPPSIVLMAAGTIQESVYYRCLADKLELEFVDSTPPKEIEGTKIPRPEELKKMAQIVTIGNSGIKLLDEIAPKSVYLAPEGADFVKIENLVRKCGVLRHRICISTRSSNLISLRNGLSERLIDFATKALLDRFPHYSAMNTIMPTQAVILVLGLLLTAYLMFFAPMDVRIGLHLLATFFYLECIAIKIYAWIGFGSVQQQRIWKPPPLNESELPDYSILVPLYHEDGQVKDLVNALERIRWPVERLEIMLICEADDKKTIDACKHETDRPNRFHFSVIPVPVCQPRTKPKAMNYALPLCRGEYVVVYDAEDRPHPLQLQEAFDVFSKGENDLACLQAPLAIRNAEEGILTRLFAIEYLALFDGVLPALTRLCLRRHLPLPIPLGGTSNHFRREVLLDVGGWDAYNVTEDADLGVRLAREGYRIGTITQTTREEAPVEISIWLKQRTRWFKGWYQTWLVHMRHPIWMYRDLGLLGMVLFQLLTLGMAISTLVHPLLVYHVVRAIIDLSSGTLSLQDYCFAWLSVIMVLLGYLSLIVVANDTLKLRNVTISRWVYLAIPLYWILLSFAAWRALWHLIRYPHRWEKTPHRLQNA